MTTTALSVRAAPPTPRGSLVLGNLGALVRDPLQLFLDAATQHGGLVRFRFAHLHVYLVSEPAYIRHVLTDHMRNYVKGVSYASLRHALGDGLLVAEGELWRRQRRLMNPAFGRQILRDKAPVMLACVAAAIARWERHAAAGESFDLVAEMMRLAFDVVGRVLMGGDIADAMAELEDVVPVVSGWVYRHMSAPLKLPPWLPTPNNVRYRRAMRVLDRVVQRVIDEHRAHGERPDLMSLLMSARDDDTGRAMSDRQLRDEVLTFLLAGHETSGSALTWVYALLADHPEHERRLHAELDTVLGERPVAVDDLARLPFAGQILDEAMRLYPPAWSFTRTAVERDRLGPFEIPAGAMVVISPWVNHRLARFWQSPERFDPERFAPAAVQTHDAYQYFPFGGGPHMCIGKHLTLFEIKLAMAAISQRYRLVRETPGRVKLAPRVSLTPAEPIRVRLARRRGGGS